MAKTTDLTKLPTTASAIQKVAAKEYSKKAKRNRIAGNTSYREGDPLDKVWDNYQLTKGLKRDFKDLCARKSINSSKFFRSCIRLLIKKDGDLTKTLKAVEKLDTSNLTE